MNIKLEVINLIKRHNTRDQGIYIPISVEDYVDKIFYQAAVVPYFVLGELKAFIAYYNNDVAKENAFLTMILVSADYQGKGIGKLLLDLSINDLKNRGFKNYSLEALKENAIALKLYSSYGFIITKENNDLWEMRKKL